MIAIYHGTPFAPPAGPGTFGMVDGGAPLAGCTYAPPATAWTRFFFGPGTGALDAEEPGETAPPPPVHSSLPRPRFHRALARYYGLRG